MKEAKDAYDSGSTTTGALKVTDSNSKPSEDAGDIENKSRVDEMNGVFEALEYLSKPHNNSASDADLRLNAFIDDLNALVDRTPFQATSILHRTLFHLHCKSFSMHNKTKAGGPVEGDTQEKSIASDHLEALKKESDSYQSAVGLETSDVMIVKGIASAQEARFIETWNAGVAKDKSKDVNDKYLEAIKYLRTAEEIYNDDFQIKYNLAAYICHTGDYVETKKQLDVILRSSGSGRGKKYLMSVMDDPDFVCLSSAPPNDLKQLGITHVSHR